jgi:hypothetical protein
MQKYTQAQLQLGKAMACFTQSQPQMNFQASEFDDRSVSKRPQIRLNLINRNTFVKKEEDADMVASRRNLIKNKTKRQFRQNIAEI